MKQKLLCLANVYGPNNDNPMFFSNFFNDLNNFSSCDVILGRDFNLILNNDLDKIDGECQHSNYKASEVVRSHMRAINLSDFFRIFHPFMKTFTRIQITPFTASRIDFFPVSNSRTSFTQSINVLPSIRSDHRVVKLVLRFHQFNIGPGYWKFNNNLLDDDNYISFIKQVLQITNPIIKQKFAILKLDGTL